MAYKVKWTKKAKEQRKDLFRYGYKVWGIAQTKSFWAALCLKMRMLGDAPYACAKEMLLENFLPEARSMVLHPNYKVVYLIDESTESIYIIGFWDTRKEPQKNVKATI